MEKVKIGVIGTGHLGKLHTKMLSQIENCELVGVFDNNPDMANAVAAEFNTKAFSDMNSLIDSCQGISIAATTSAHYELAKVCLEKNKHIMIEKPITATIPQAEEIVALAKSKGLNLQVGHIERFNPALLSLEKFIFNPSFIQSDRLAQFNPRGTDVAVVLDLMIHDIDIILHLIKSDVKQVDASGIAVVSDTVDIANARIMFENGAVANVTASRISQKRMRKMRLFQKDAYFSLDFNSGASEVFRLMPLEENIETPFVSFGEIGIGDKKKRVVFEQPEVMEVNALKYEIELFVKSVQNNTPPVVTGEDGLKALKVADMVLRKIEESSLNSK